MQPAKRSKQYEGLRRAEALDGQDWLPFGSLRRVPLLLMVPSFAPNRPVRPARVVVLLASALLVSGCRALPAPVWQSSATIGSSVAVEANFDRRQLQQAQTNQHVPTARALPKAALVRLVALDDTAPDPPYQPRFPSFARFGSWRLRQISSKSESAKPPSALAVRPGLPPTQLEGSDDDSGSLIFETEGSEFDEDLEEDKPLLDPHDEAGDELANCGFTFRDDIGNLFPVLYNDTLACITWPNAIILAAAAGGAVAIRENLDGEVRDYTARHSSLWGEGTQVLRQFGEFSYQLPAIAAVYGWSLWRQDEYMHEFGKTLISAYSIAAVTTVVIKGITDTNRPTDEFQDGDYGFPSFHAASTFSIAAVVDEYYGWPAGIPCYVLAGLVGWSRIDQREHDLSDVVFGSVLGFVIGKSVAAAHMDGITGCQVVPCFDPATQSFGAVFHKKY